MGNRIVKFEFTPEENEQIETCIIIPKETRSIICGVVKDHNYFIVKDAVVELFEVASEKNKCLLKPIAHNFTDENGQFSFGPVYAKMHYVIKVWVNDIKIREVTVCPDNDEEVCEYKKTCKGSI